MATGTLTLSCVALMALVGGCVFPRPHGATVEINLVDPLNNKLIQRCWVIEERQTAPPQLLLIAGRGPGFKVTQARLRIAESGKPFKQEQADVLAFPLGIWLLAADRGTRYVFLAEGYRGEERNGDAVYQDAVASGKMTIELPVLNSNIQRGVELNTLQEVVDVDVPLLLKENAPGVRDFLAMMLRQLDRIQKESRGPQASEANKLANKVRAELKSPPASTQPVIP